MHVRCRELRLVDSWLPSSAARMLTSGLLIWEGVHSVGSQMKMNTTRGIKPAPMHSVPTAVRISS